MVQQQYSMQERIEFLGNDFSNWGLNRMVSHIHILYATWIFWPKKKDSTSVRVISWCLVHCKISFFSIPLFVQDIFLWIDTLLLEQKRKISKTWESTSFQGSGNSQNIQDSWSSQPRLCISVQFGGKMKTLREEIPEMHMSQHPCIEGSSVMQRLESWMFL